MPRATVRWTAGDTEIELDGDVIRWTSPAGTIVQAATAFLADGPPPGVALPPFGFQTAAGAPCSVLEVLLGALAPDEAAPAQRIWEWKTRRTHAVADAARDALLARIAAAGGPVDAARALLDRLRGPASHPVLPHALARLERTSAPALAEAARAIVEPGLRAPGLRDHAWTVGVALGALAPVAAEIEAIAGATGDDAVARARALWQACRRVGAEPGAPFERLRAHPTPDVAFFASCAARHAAWLRGAALPALSPPHGRPDLGPPEAESSTRTVRCGWTATEAAAPPTTWRDAPLCRVCAADEVDVTYHRDDSGTGWRSESIEGRCRACGAFTHVEIDD